MIFEDPSRRRWRRAVLVFSLLTVAAAVVLGISIASIVVPATVANPLRARSQVQAKALRASLAHDAKPVYTPDQMRRMQRMRAQEKRRRSKLVGGATGAPMPLPEGAVVAFVVSSDPTSIASLEKHIGSIDVVVPDWFELPGPGCVLDEHVDEKTRRVLGRTDVIVLPRLANLSVDT
jgi:hypothetical protein